MTDLKKIKIENYEQLVELLIQHGWNREKENSNRKIDWNKYEIAVKIDLQNVYLKDANLYKADLKNADLRNADLRKSHLEDANLYKADLRNADLRQAELPKANLQYADLRNAKLENADLYEADLKNAKITDTAENRDIVEDIDDDDEYDSTRYTPDNINKIIWD